MNTQHERPLHVAVEADGRIEIRADGATLALLLEPDAEQVAVLVFAAGSDVLLGQLMISRAGVEVAQAGRLRGAYVEWP